MKRNMNEVKKNNKGFSLVELIVVIAIMVVLVAVLAPVFTKYVEQSRRATDVQNANSIAEAVLADAADGTIKADVTKVVAANDPTAIKDTPVVKGSLPDGTKTTFSYKYVLSTNKVQVYITGTKYDLTNEAEATAYKDAAAGTLPSSPAGSVAD